MGRETMERIYERVNEAVEAQNFLTTIGAKLEQAEKGRVVLSCKNRHDLTQQNGFLHGGVTAALAEVACGSAALTMAEEHHHILSAEFKMNLLRPVVCNQIQAEGTVLKAGRKLVVTESVVTDPQTGKVLAKMTATMIPIADE